MEPKSWLFPPRPIGKRRAAALIAEHNALVNRCVRLEFVVRELLTAYARSEAQGDGGSVDWDDVDGAFKSVRHILARIK